MSRLTRLLVDIPSVTGQEREVLDWLTDELTRTGFRVRKLPVSSQRYNLAVTLQGEPVPVWLCTHLDTVAPWIRSHESAGRLWGRGVCDAKGIAAAMICAVRRLAETGERRAGLLFVVGEETDSVGAKSTAEIGLEAEYIVVGEPTEGKLVEGQKGTLVFRLSARGESGHSADPAAGESAIHLLVPALQRLLEAEWETDPVFGRTTLNLGHIEGGAGANVVAGSAWVEGIFRVAGQVESVRREASKLIGDALQFDVLSSCDPFRFYVPEGFPGTVVAFGSDAPYLAPLGRVLMAGPGSIHFAHRDDEQIGVDELEAGVDLYVRLVLRLLGAES